MHKGLKLAHILGIVIFLGSIFTFITISALIESASLENIAFGRKIISNGTNILTLPGIWILAITGTLMGYKRYGLRHRFFQIKLTLITLILINAYFFIVPAVSSATEIAIRSISAGQLLPEYNDAYMKESLFGAANVILAILSAIVGTWKLSGNQNNV